jgi:hypothetical protein
MKIYQLLLLFIGNFALEPVYSQTIIKTSFAFGKSAFYFFGKESPSIGKFHLNDDDYGRTPLAEYKLGLFFPKQKFGIQFNRVKFFEIDGNLNKPIEQFQRGDFISRKFRVTELLGIFQIQKIRHFEIYFSSGFCYRNGFESRFGKNEWELYVDIGYYNSYGLSNNVIGKFKPFSWLFLSADFGIQSYFKSQKSVIFRYPTPRFNLMSGLAIGTEFNLTFKKRP